MTIKQVSSQFFCCCLSHLVQLDKWFSFQMRLPNGTKDLSDLFIGFYFSLIHFWVIDSVLISAWEPKVKKYHLNLVSNSHEMIGEMWNWQFLLFNIEKRKGRRRGSPKSQSEWTFPLKTFQCLERKRIIGLWLGELVSPHLEK